MKYCRFIGMLLLLLPAVSGAQPPPPPHIGAIGRIQFAYEKFALAFIPEGSEDSNLRIQVSITRDGVKWNDAKFPNLDALNLKLRDTSGVGICGSIDGNDIMVVFNYPFGIFLVEGKVTASSLTETSVSWTSPAKYFALSRVDSAPSCTFLLAERSPHYSS